MILFAGKVFEGIFLKRYKRFFADVFLDNGTTITAHTPNTGSMKGLCESGNRCLVSYKPSPSRKLHYTLEALQIENSWVGCNTSHPNQLIYHAIKNNQIDELTGYHEINREVPYGQNKRSRIDLYLSNHQSLPNAFVEIKNVTLKEGNLALFPDAVTSRGLKHLLELKEQVSNGFRSVLVFVIQRTDCIAFAPADNIDPEYSKALRSAQPAGVEILCLTAQISSLGLQLSHSVPLLL